MRLSGIFSTKDIISKVRELAAKHPDVTYFRKNETQCSYALGESVGANYKAPGCLFGQIFPTVWTETDELIAIEHVLVGTDEEDNEVDRPFRVIVDADADVAWLAQVQQAQDNGMPWGGAVKMADGV